MNKQVVIYLQDVLNEAYQSLMKRDPDMAMCNIDRALEIVEQELNNKRKNDNGQAG